MMRRGWLLAGILVVHAVGADELSGSVALVSDGQALRSEEAAEAVVYFRPTSPPKVVPAAEPYVMGTQRKQFMPRILPITVGSEVRFPNRDPILHNAFSTSPASTFDVGVYGNGDLVVWLDRATPWHQKLSAGGKPLAIQLDLTQKRVPPHMNKFGKPYGRASDAGY
jgi:hypothetical protein